jgi:hypothetical protein
LLTRMPISRPRRDSTRKSSVRKDTSVFGNIERIQFNVQGKQ